MPSSDRRVTLLPQPDSPTRPSVWPALTEKATRSAASSGASPAGKAMVRSLTSSSSEPGLGPLPLARSVIGPPSREREVAAEAVGKPVADEAEGDAHQDDH